MRYTERGREMQARKSSKLVYFLSSISTILIGCIVITSIFSLLIKVFFNTRLDIANNQPNQVLDTTTQLNDKANTYNNETYNKFLNGGSKVIFEPIHQYTNDYILKELKDNAINNQNRIKQQNNNNKNKFAYINSNNGNNSSIWEDCPPHEKDGYDLNKTIILCKDGKKVVMPIR